MERAVPAKESRAGRLHREREIAAHIKDVPREERLRAWQDRTGKSEAALYRRLAELDGSGVRTEKVRTAGGSGPYLIICFCICFQPPAPDGRFLKLLVLLTLSKTESKHSVNPSAVLAT
jgi:hypothetical protein